MAQKLRGRSTSNSRRRWWVRCLRRFRQVRPIAMARVHWLALEFSIAVTMFFLLYDALAHRNQPYMPIIGSTGTDRAAPEATDSLVGSTEDE